MSAHRWIIYSAQLTGRSVGATPCARTPKEIDVKAGRESYVAQLHVPNPSLTAIAGQNKSILREYFPVKIKTRRAATRKGDGTHIPPFVQEIAARTGWAASRRAISARTAGISGALSEPSWVAMRRIKCRVF